MAAVGALRSRLLSGSLHAHSNGLAFCQQISLKRHFSSHKILVELDEAIDHARQITKSMMRKQTTDKLVNNREADIKNFVSFVSRDSIQKFLQVYMERLRQRKQ